MEKNKVIADFPNKDENNKNKKSVKLLIDLLNEKVNRKMKPQGRNKELILRLFRKGYTYEDIEKVILYKCKEWIGTDFEKYLAPNTLFGIKFEKYLEQTDYEIKSNNYITIRSKSINDIVKFIKCPRTIQEDLTEEICEAFENCEACTRNWLYKNTL